MEPFFLALALIWKQILIFSFIQNVAILGTKEWKGKVSKRHESKVLFSEIIFSVKTTFKTFNFL